MPRTRPAPADNAFFSAFRLSAEEQGMTDLPAAVGRCATRGDRCEGRAGGLFHNDTRLLSTFRLLMNGQQPSLLSSAVSQEC